MISFTVEVCLPARSWKRNKIRTHIRNKIRTHIVTARSDHEARRKVLEMYLSEKRQVISTQVIDRYPEGV